MVGKSLKMIKIKFQEFFKEKNHKKIFKNKLKRNGEENGKNKIIKICRFQLIHSSAFNKVHDFQHIQRNHQKADKNRRGTSKLTVKTH